MGDNLESIKAEPKKAVESSGWLMDNIAHPFVNAAVIDPINAVASVTEAVSGKHLPRIDLLSVPESTGTASWLAQTFSGGVGAIAPYVLAGKLTGGALESGGRVLESNNLIKTGGMTAKFLASERTGMIVGAGLYGGARDPMGHETRFGNAVGSMVGFGAFEYGNSLTKGLSLSKSIPLRALVGAVGGTSQMMTANLISEGSVGSTDNLMKAASSGAALNLFLPAAQHSLGKAVDAVNVRMGRPIPVDHFVARENWSDNGPLQDLIARSPLSRVQRTTVGETSINQDSNVVQLANGAGPEKLGHEISHRITAKQAEPELKSAAELLKTDPEAAKQKFVDIRTAQEKAAIEAESRVKAAADIKSPYADTNPDVIHQLRANAKATYGDLFSKEAAQFESSGGKFRPATDFSGTNYLGKQDNGLHLFSYEKPVDSPLGGKEKVIGYETNDDRSFQRWTKADAIADAGKTWGTIETFKKPHDTGYYGTVSRVDSFPDKSTEYHIVKGENGVPDNTVMRIYPDGLTTEHGFVTSTVTHPDGTVEYGKMDGSKAVKYATPQETWYGKVASSDSKTDGTTFYNLTDGSTVEHYENSLKPLKVQMAMPDGTVREMQVSSAWRSNGKASHSMLDKLYERGEVPPEGEPKADSAPIKSEYILADESTTLEQVFHPDHIEVTERTPGGPESTFTPNYIVENYPAPISTPEGIVTRMVRTADSNIYDLTDGKKVQVYDKDHTRPTDYGDANRVVYLKDDFVQFTKLNGNIVTTNTGEPPRLIPITGFGDNFKAVETTPDGMQYYHRPDGSVIEHYPSEVTSTVGPIVAFEKTANGLILYSPPGASTFDSLELNFANKNMTSSDPQGNLVTGGFKSIDSNFKLLRRFNPAQYPEGQMIPGVGKVRSIETNADGYNTYLLADGKYVTDAPAP